MGAHLCSKNNSDAPHEALCFHEEAKGAQVRLDPRGRTARRSATFHDGLVFSRRPVRPGERVRLRVLVQERGWRGGLRVGFTRLDPARLAPPCLPPFLCPDLEAQSPTWAAMLPERCVLAGTVLSFWVDRRGRLLAQVHAGRPLLLRTGVLLGAPLWAVMDVYGTTKAIQLLDPTASPGPTAMREVLCEEVELEPEPEGKPGEECAICFHHSADTCLVPCGHSHFCSSCVQRVFRDTAKCPLCRRQIEAVAKVWPLRTRDGS